MRINFEGLSSASTSSQLPTGPYAFTVDAVNPDYASQDKGTKALEVKCHVIDGVDFEDGSSTMGLQRTLRFWYPNGDQKDGGKFCLGRLNEFVKACGVDTSKDGFDPDELLGTSFKARCRIKAGTNGTPNEEFDRFAELR